MRPIRPQFLPSHTTGGENRESLTRVVPADVPAPGMRLDVTLDGSSRLALLPPIQPNEIFAKEFPLIPNRAIAGESFFVESAVSLDGDIDSGNDTLSTAIGEPFPE